MSRDSKNCLVTASESKVSVLKLTVLKLTVSTLKIENVEIDGVDININEIDNVDNISATIVNIKIDIIDTWQYWNVTLATDRITILIELTSFAIHEYYIHVIT